MILIAKLQCQIETYCKSSLKNTQISLYTITDFFNSINNDLEAYSRMHAFSSPYLNKN